MTRLLKRTTACLLAVMMLVSLVPSYTSAAEMGNAPDDILIEDANVIDDMSEVLDEETAESDFSEYDEGDAPMPEEEDTEEETAGEFDIEETVPEETAGTEADAEEFIGIYNLRVVWPDGAVNKIELKYYGSDREDVINNITVKVAEELNKFDVHESEYNCEYTWNRKKSTSVKEENKDSSGLVIDRKRITTDYYDVVVKTIQPAFADEPDDVQVLAHRGTVNVPENTLSAFRVSAVKGFHYVGADLHFTSDGVPMIIHDATLNRTARNADGSKLSEYVDIEEIPYAEARKYDVGLYCGEFWRGEKVPTFEEFIKLCAKLDLEPNLHLKSSIYMKNEWLAELVDIVKRNGMQGRVVWAADDIDYLRYVRTLDPVSGLDMIVYRWVPSVISKIRELKTDTNFVEIAIGKSLFTNRIALACYRNGVYVTAHANTPEDVTKMDSTVRLISTDYLLPDEVKTLARQRPSTGEKTFQTPVAGTDYRLQTCLNLSMMFSIRSSALASQMTVNKVQQYTEMNDFRMRLLGDGYYQILNTRSMLTLEVKGGSTCDGAAIILNTWTGADKQRWKIVKNTNGTVTLVNKASGKAIQTKNGKLTAGTVLVQATRNGSDAQRFWMVKEPNQVKVNYTKNYYIESKGAPGFAVKVKNNSTAASANICLAKKKTDYSLKYQLIYSGDGYYRIMNLQTKKFLTVKGNSAASGTNVVQDVWKNASGQRWMPKLNKDGSYTLVSKLGTCLQIDAGTTVPGSGTNVNVGKSSNAAAQHWKLEAA